MDDDAQLNKILIELGTEEVRVRNLADGKRTCAKSNWRKFSSCWSRSTNTPTPSAVTAAISPITSSSATQKTLELPRHLVKVRDGNDETIHYFLNEEELAEFGDAESGPGLIRRGGVGHNHD